MNLMLGHTGPILRRLDDMPERVPPGAKEAALLTIWVKEQEFAFKPIMDSLAVLASLKDWSDSFLVADKLTPGFNWKQAPFRKYASFQDFYKRELESTWGSWDNLQATYAEIAKGAITEEEGKARVLRKHGGTGANQYTVKLAEHGTAELVTTKSALRIKYGTADYILARLERDSSPENDFGELAAKIEAKQISARAAGIKAGFIKERTVLDQLRCLWKKATLFEKKQFLNEVGK
jgi:hypothetical protein